MKSEWRECCISAIADLVDENPSSTADLSQNFKDNVT